MCAREEILRLAFRELSAQRGADPGAIEVTIRCHGVELRYRSDPGEFQPRPELTDRQSLILQQFHGDILTAKEIAQKTGYTLNSYLYDGLAEMVRLGLLRKAGNEGYQVPT